MNLLNPQRRNLTFTEVWNESEKFLDDYKSSPFYNAAGCTMEESNITLTYFLLYNRYGNSQIANEDYNQFKFKVFGLIMQYGPTWEQKLKIQAKLRSLGLDDTSEIYKGAKAIYNHAYNPETSPSTQSDVELTYINDQNVTNYKKSKLEGLALLADLIKDDVTSMYIDKFRKLFKQFVAPMPTLMYVTEEIEL